MRTARLLPLLTAGALVIGASTAVLAEVAGIGGGDDEHVVDPLDASLVVVADVEETPPVDVEEVETSPVESVEEVETPPEDSETVELFGDEDLDEQGAPGANADAFSAWVSSFDLEGCHRGQTIAAVAREVGPVNFDPEVHNPADYCVPLAADHPGNRPEGAGPPDHAGAEGRPAHAGEPGPPDHAGAEGRPAHAGEPGPPEHAGAPEGAGPPSHAGEPGPPDHAGAEGRPAHAGEPGPPEGAGPPEGPPSRSENGPPGPPPHAGPNR